MFNDIHIGVDKDLRTKPVQLVKKLLELFDAQRTHFTPKARARVLRHGSRTAKVCMKRAIERAGEYALTTYDKEEGGLPVHAVALQLAQLDRTPRQKKQDKIDARKRARDHEKLVVVLGDTF